MSFFLKCCYFSWTLPVLLQCGCLTCHCVHTLTPREYRERQESKSSKKNIFNEHPVHYQNLINILNFPKIKYMMIRRRICHSCESKAFFLQINCSLITIKVKWRNQFYRLIKGCSEVIIFDLANCCFWTEENKHRRTESSLNIIINSIHIINSVLNYLKAANEALKIEKRSYNQNEELWQFLGRDWPLQKITLFRPSIFPYDMFAISKQLLVRKNADKSSAWDWEPVW